MRQELMWKLLLCSLFWLAFCIHPVHSKGNDFVKKSLRQVKAGDLNDAYKTLQNARQKQKDDFGVDYVYSLYFLSPYQKTLKLDSAYAFCLSAIDKFGKENAEGRIRYAELQIDSLELYSRKDYLDSLGFSQAERLESEAAYQFFLEKFPQSARAETARRKRASLAFQQARQQNSYEAFMAFLAKYPDAGEASSAKEISDLLAFENTARKGQISDWENFISKNPNNQYLIKAQNRLFELATLYHTPESYYQFITNYPENPNTAKAWDWIFYLEKTGKNTGSLTQKYPDFPLLRFETRLRLRDEPLIPFIERGRFGFMDRYGKPFIHPTFDSLPEDARCDITSSAFVKIFRKRKVSLFCMDTIPVSEAEFDNAEWFSDGILKVFKGGKQGLLSMTGYQILGTRYEDIQRLTNNLLSIQQGNRFFLFTLKGQKLEIQGLDQVLAVGTYIVGRLGERFAIFSEEEAMKSLQNQPPVLQFKFTSIQKSGADRMLLYKGEEANLLCGNKLLVLNLQPGSVLKECPWGWLVENQGSTNVIDSLGNTLPRSFEAIRIHGNLAVARFQNKFGLIDRTGKPVVDFAYDSIALVVRSSFLARKGNNRFLIFESGKKIGFSGNRNPEVLRYATNRGIFASYFLVLSDSLDRKAVFSRQGRAILPFAYDNISMLDAHLFATYQDRKMGIADTNGLVLFKPSFTGASPISREFVCVSNGKNFSILNLITRKPVVTKLSGLARNFGSSRNLFIIRIRDKAGIIDLSGKQIIPSIYEDIQYWNPTRCLVKRNGFWYFYQMESGKELVKAIKNIRILSERDNETIYEIEVDKKVGVESTLRGEIAPSDNDEIVPFESNSGTFFFAGRRVASSLVYNLTYVDLNGELIKTQLLTEEEYEKIVCD